MHVTFTLKYVKYFKNGGHSDLGECPCANMRERDWRDSSAVPWGQIAIVVVVPSGTVGCGVWSPGVGDAPRGRFLIILYIMGSLALVIGLVCGFRSGFCGSWLSWFAFWHGLRRHVGVLGGRVRPASRQPAGVL